MRIDWYLRSVLTVIAGALVYLCLVLTPFPTAFAQTARTPGESTGPGEMVIVGWRLPPGATLPVSLPGAVTVSGDVRVTNDVRVTGRVQTEQREGTADRVVLAGWEDAAFAPGSRPTPLNSQQRQGLPVTSLPPR